MVPGEQTAGVDLKTVLNTKEIRLGNDQRHLTKLENVKRKGILRKRVICSGNNRII